MSRQSERAEAGKYPYRYKYIHWMVKVQGYNGPIDDISFSRLQ